MEIERKFKLSKLPDLTGARMVHIVQSYIISNPESDVRVRKSSEKGDIRCVVTLKKKTDTPGVREEYETAIPEEAFDILRLVALKTIIKDRYFTNIYSGGLREATIDVFHGKNEGLIIAEVEFSDVGEARKFVAPKWMGKDVTDDPRYLNKNL